MIYFFFDYLINVMTPFNSYLLIWNLDKYRLSEIILIGIFLDIVYQRWMSFVLIFLIGKLIISLTSDVIRNDYVKSILGYLLLYNIMFFCFGNSLDYLKNFIIGFILSLMLSFVEKKIKA